MIEETPVIEEARLIPYMGDFRIEGDGIIFELSRYLEDLKERDRKIAWEKTFGRKEKFD